MPTWTQPRVAPPVLLPAAAGAVVIAVALPIFLLAGWRVSGWALGAVLWFGSEALGWVLTRLQGRTGNLAAAGVVAAARLGDGARALRRDRADRRVADRARLPGREARDRQRDLTLAQLRRNSWNAGASLIGSKSESPLAMSRQPSQTLAARRRCPTASSVRPARLSQQAVL